MSYDGWLESTKNQELRDSLNFRGIPSGATGATLASQQGTRGAPIADASCVPGLELFKVSPLPGTGQIFGTPPAFRATGDYLWASAGNLDLSFMMWNLPSILGTSPRGSATSNPDRLAFGIMLRGDSATQLGRLDTFGAPVSDIVLVSGTLAWRIRTAIYSTSQSIVTQGLIPGGTLTAGTSTLNGIDTGSAAIFGSIPFATRPGTSGTQFPVQTPLPFAVYYFASEAEFSVANRGLGVLLDLMTANYAGFRIYDFTLQSRLNEGWQIVPATMPQSQSGANTNSPTIPDPSDVSQTIANPNYWYIEDAVIAPAAERSISVASAWSEDRNTAVGDTLTISDLAIAFDVLPAGEPISVAVSPTSADLANAAYTYNPTTRTFAITSSVAGEYQLVLTAAMTNAPGRRAEANLNVRFR